MTSAYSRWCLHFAFIHFQPALKSLLNNCVKLYWYSISSFWNLNWGSNWPSAPSAPPPTSRKNSPQKPSLIRVKGRNGMQKKRMENKRNANQTHFKFQNNFNCWLLMLAKPRKVCCPKLLLFWTYFQKGFFLRSKNNVNFTKICFLKSDCISMRR